MAARIIIFISLLGFCLGCPALTNGQEKGLEQDSSRQDLPFVSHDEDDADEAPKKIPREVKPRFTGYGKQIKGFKNLCAQIEKDGQREFFYSYLMQNRIKDEKCPACYQLIKVFEKSCKPKKKKVKKKKPKAEKQKAASSDQADPPRKEKQKKPSPQVEAELLAVFSSIANNDDLRPDSYAAIDNLVRILNKAEGKTKIERAYCRGFEKNIVKPFIPYQELNKQQKQFQKVCYYIGKDNQKDLFYQALKDNLNVDKDCPACRPLFKAFADQCFVPKVKIKKGEKKPEIDYIKNRRPTPHIDVEDSVIELFTRLVNNEKNVDQKTLAVIKLASATRSLRIAGQGPFSYTTALAKLIEKPFEIQIDFINYRPQFEEFCAALRQDGRRESFYQIVQSADFDDRKCKACRPMFKGLREACAPPESPPEEVSAEESSPEEALPEKLAAEQDPEEKEESAAEQGQEKKEVVPPPKQRLPHLDVLNKTCGLFIMIAGKPEFIRQNYQAASLLSELLRKKEGKSKAEIVYYDVLAEFIIAPFMSLLPRQSKKNSGQDSGWREGEEPDGLWQF